MNMIGRSSLLLVTFLAAVYCSVVVQVTDEEWDNYKVKFGKQYGSDEDGERRGLYMKKKEEVEAHNALYQKGDVSFEVELNNFADLTPEEAQQRVCGSETKRIISEYLKHNNPVVETPAYANITVQNSVDWRTKGAVTPIKNQEQCGSCWAFSTTGTLEGQWKIKKGELLSFSEQQIVDCDKVDHGCQGGYPSWAYNYITKAGGIESEQSYPYTARDGTCNFDKSKVVATIDNGKNIEKTEDALKAAVTNVGPISVCICASDTGFQSYKQGIYSVPNCGSNCNGIDHCVLAIGYGDENGKKYWIIKNSWGTSWGMEGYMYMARDENNMCGISCIASYPIVN